MRYAIVSDIHANVEALRRVLADAASAGAGRVVCLGDVVGYGPQPAEAVALVRRASAVVLAGNHDDAVSGRGDASAFSGLAADAVTRHREALSAEDRAWLRGLPYVGRVGKAVAAHGDFVDPPKFYYVDDEDGAAANFDARPEQLMFVGHTHAPAIAVVGDSGVARMTSAQDFALEPNKRYIVNPGSVGYPRVGKGFCQSSYVVYDDEDGTVEFRYVPFAVESVMARGRSTARRRRAVLAAVALAAGAAAAAVVMATRPDPEKETVVVEVEKAEDPALLLAERELTLRPGDRKVRANLLLDPGPAEMSVEFRGPGGETVGTPFRQTVQKSYRKAHKVPEGAVAAIFAVRRPSADCPARVDSLTPSAER